MSEQKPVSKDTLRKDILDSEEDSLRINAQSKRKSTSRERTTQTLAPANRLSNALLNITHIGNSASIAIPDPEIDPKSRLAWTSLLFAARWAWKPTWWITTR